MSDAMPATLGRSKRPLWRRILKWTVRIVAGLVVVLVVIWSVANYLASRALNEQVEKIRAAGQPLTFAQQAWRQDKLPQDQDAAPYYEAAILLQRGTNDVNDLWAALPGPGGKAQRALTAEQLGKARDLLAENALALDLVDRGAALPACDFDTRVEYGVGATLPLLSKSLALAKALSLRTLWLASTGEPDKAVDSVVSSLRMTRMFDAQPILIAHMMKVAILAMTANDVPAILESGSPSQAQLQKLQQALLDVERTIDVKHVWVAERVYVLEIMRNLFAEKRELQWESGGRPSIPEAWSGTAVGGPFVRWMAAEALQRFDEYIAISGKDWPDRLAAAKEISERPQGSWLSGRQFADMLAPSAWRMELLSARMVASLRSARAAVLIEMYRRQAGRLPETLDDVQAALQIQVPADPFTGKGLVYRRTADGYLVYSLGESRRDQGGPTTQPGENGNWGYRVRVPFAASRPHAEAAPPA